MRDVFVKPSAEFELSPDVLLELLKLLYGLADSVDCLGRTFSDHILNNIGIIARSKYNAFVVQKNCKSARWFMCYSRRRLFASWNPNYSQLGKSIEKRFQCRDREFDNVQFCGFNIE